jgi:hypothetical protein
MVVPFVHNGEISQKNQRRSLLPQDNRGTEQGAESGRDRLQTSTRKRVKRLGFRQALRLSLKMHRNTSLKMDAPYRT